MNKRYLKLIAVLFVCVQNHFLIGSDAPRGGLPFKSGKAYDNLDDVEDVPNTSRRSRVPHVNKSFNGSQSNYNYVTATNSRIDIIEPQDHSMLAYIVSSFAQSIGHSAGQLAVEGALIGVRKIWNEYGSVLLPPDPDSDGMSDNERKIYKHNTLNVHAETLAVAGAETNHLMQTMEINTQLMQIKMKELAAMQKELEEEGDPYKKRAIKALIYNKENALFNLQQQQEALIQLLSADTSYRLQKSARIEEKKYKKQVKREAKDWAKNNNDLLNFDMYKKRVIKKKRGSILNSQPAPLVDISPFKTISEQATKELNEQLSVEQTFVENKAEKDAGFQEKFVQEFVEDKRASEEAVENI